MADPVVSDKTRVSGVNFQEKQVLFTEKFSATKYGHLYSLHIYLVNIKTNVANGDFVCRHVPKIWKTDATKYLYSLFPSIVLCILRSKVIIYTTNPSILFCSFQLYSTLPVLFYFSQFCSFPFCSAPFTSILFYLFQFYSTLPVLFFSLLFYSTLVRIIITNTLLFIPVLFYSSSSIFLSYILALSILVYFFLFVFCCIVLFHDIWPVVNFLSSDSLLSTLLLL